LKLGILKTGEPPEALARFGGYPAMFRKLLGEDAYDYAVYDVEAGELPVRAESCDAYIVTGSSCGVYDPLPWIAQLKGFLRDAGGKAALVGICFGHQVMAEAFGGKVMKSPRGWGLGAHRYEVFAPQPWMAGETKITLPASHQDQVTEPPPAAEVVAGSDFTPYGLLAYTDQPAISLQLHPEFEPDFAIALVERQRGSGLNDEEAGRAVASLREPMDRDIAANWIRNFLRSAVP
jgi:GMP synthase-like glutamine amidotransferase